jgi:predicted amidophosphoribosyltransferase
MSALWDFLCGSNPKKVKACPKCQHFEDSSSKFCADCGTLLADAREKPYSCDCGAQVPYLSAQFCHQCGKEYPPDLRGLLMAEINSSGSGWGWGEY